MSHQFYILDSNLACKSLGGQAFLPTSEHHFNVIQIEETRISQSKELELIYSGCQATIWFPVIKSNDLRELVEFDNKSNTVAQKIQDILPQWKVGNNGDHFQRCWNMDIKKQSIEDKNCDLVKSCITCIWLQKPVLRLRGLCKKSSMDSHYTMVIGFNYHGVFGKNFEIHK